MAKLIFINGSINSGKTTTSKLVAEKLGAEFINFDDLNDQIPNFDLAKDIPRSFDLGIKKINDLNDRGKDVVANYVIRTEDWDRLLSDVKTSDKFFFTLAPRLEVAQSQRGDRVLTEWEMKRITYHYNTGVANPVHGEVIDSSELTVDEVVDQIIKSVKG